MNYTSIKCTKQRCEERIIQFFHRFSWHPAKTSMTKITPDMIHTDCWTQVWWYCAAGYDVIRIYKYKPMKRFAIINSSILRLPGYSLLNTDLICLVSKKLVIFFVIFVWLNFKEITTTNIPFLTKNPKVIHSSVLSVRLVVDENFNFCFTQVLIIYSLLLHASTIWLLMQTSMGKPLL